MMYENGYLREFDPRVACAVGINAACIVSELDYSTKKYDVIAKRDDLVSKDGHIWLNRTCEEWHERMGWTSIRTIRRELQTLEEKGIILTANYNKYGFDRSKWYTIDYVALDRILEENKEMYAKGEKDR